MTIYKVDSVVCDYGLFENGELKLICNNRSNALLIKAIMEKDERCGSGFYGNPRFNLSDHVNFEEQLKLNKIT